MDILVKVEDAHVDVFLNIGCCRFDAASYHVALRV